MAQKKYVLMKTKGTFMKTQAVEHKIVAMGADMLQLKEKLALSPKVEEVDTKNTGGGTNKQCQKRDETWKKVPPKAGKPSTKKVRTKDFHWWEHHMAWTVPLPTDCNLKDRAKPSDAAITPPATNVTAAAATFSAKSRGSGGSIPPFFYSSGKIKIQGAKKLPKNRLNTD